MIVFRIAVTVFAVLLIGFGLIVTISPIPFGFVIVAVGFLLFVSVAPAEVRWLRKRWRGFDRAMHGLEKRLPRWIAKRLSDTDYDHSEDEEPERPSKEMTARAAISGRRPRTRRGRQRGDRTRQEFS